MFFCTATCFEETVDARVCLLCAGVMQQVPELTPGKRAVGKIMVFQLFKEFSFFFSQEHKITYSFLKIHFDITSKWCLHPHSGLSSSSCKHIIYSFYPTLKLPLEECAFLRFLTILSHVLNLTANDVKSIHVHSHTATGIQLQSVKLNSYAYIHEWQVSN